MLLFSEKKYNLIQPFIICCTDGFFIDCYGPCQARHNDATIFRHFLYTDDNLKQLFLPKEKTIIFVDRGLSFKIYSKMCTSINCS